MCEIIWLYLVTQKLWSISLDFSFNPLSFFRTHADITDTSNGDEHFAPDPLHFLKLNSIFLDERMFLFALSQLNIFFLLWFGLLLFLSRLFFGLFSSVLLFSIGRIKQFKFEPNFLIFGYIIFSYFILCGTKDFFYHLFLIIFSCFFYFIFNKILINF